MKEDVGNNQGHEGFDAAHILKVSMKKNLWKEYNKKKVQLSGHTITANVFPQCPTQLFYRAG